jgi:hypothetical protein
MKNYQNGIFSYYHIVPKLSNLSKISNYPIIITSKISNYPIIITPKISNYPIIIIPKISNLRNSVIKD